MFRKQLALIAVVCALFARNLEAEDFYGDLYNGPGKTFVVDGHDFNVFGSIQNFGTMYIVDALWSEYEFQNSGLIVVLGDKCSADQSLKNYAAGIIKGYGLINSDSCIENKGLIWSMGGSLLLNSWDDPKKVGISNSGTLRNNPGTSLTAIVLVPNVNNHGTIEINADGAVVFDCNNLNNEPNSVIKLYGGTLAAKIVTQKAGATFEGFGGITGNLVIEPKAVVKLTGPTNIVGDVNIAKDATLEIRDGTILVTGQTTCNGTIHLKGGQIITQGGLSGNCNIIREPSVSTVIADFNLDGNIDLNDFADLAVTWLQQAGWN